MNLTSIAVAVAVIVGPFAALADEPAKTKPYGDKPHAIPGTIEAEHWDRGAPGEAYVDVDKKNHGENYREPTAVDIEKRSDASNGHGIGWTRKGEWLVYSVEVKKAGTYRIEMPVASNKEGGLFHIEFDGKDVTGPVRVPDTGSWQKLELLVKEGVKLDQGTFEMKVLMDKDGESGSIGDFDLFRFLLQDS